MYPFFYILGRPISLYGICAVLAFATVIVLAILYARKHGLPFESILIVTAMAIGVGLVSANILYIFVTYPMDLLRLMIQHGDWSFLGKGYVLYGGLIGGLLGALWGAKLAKRRLWELEDSLVPYLPLGQAIGRVGCVLAGCCNGIPYEGPLALHYPRDPAVGYFPTQLLEALLNCALCLCLIRYRKKERRPYQMMLSYLGGYSVIRFFVEFLRGDSIRGVFGGVSTSQWISLGLLVCCVPAWIMIKRKEK